MRQFSYKSEVYGKSYLLNEVAMRYSWQYGNMNKFDIFRSTSLDVFERDTVLVDDFKLT